MRYEDFDCDDTDSFDYDSLARDCDDLYTYDEDDYEEDKEVHSDWENYYHNINDELIDEQPSLLTDAAGGTAIFHKESSFLILILVGSNPTIRFYDYHKY